MNYAKGLIMCGAVLAASAAITAAASPVEARTRPIVVTGPSQDVVTRARGIEPALIVEDDARLRRDYHAKIARGQCLERTRVAGNPRAHPAALHGLDDGVKIGHMVRGLQDGRFDWQGRGRTKLRPRAKFALEPSRRRL